MEVRYKNFVTIRDSYTQLGLSNHITFRPIKSGATVLKLKKYRQHLKICVPSAILTLIKDYPTIPHSGRSNLVRWYL